MLLVPQASSSRKTAKLMRESYKQHGQVFKDPQIIILASNWYCQLDLNNQGEGGLLPQWRCLLILLPPGCLWMDKDKENWCARGVGTTISHLPFSAADETLAFVLHSAASNRGQREGRWAGQLARPLYCWDFSILWDSAKQCSFGSLSQTGKCFPLALAYIPSQCPFSASWKVSLSGQRSSTDHWHLAEECSGSSACVGGKVVVLTWSCELEIPVCFLESPGAESERWCILPLHTRTLGQRCSLFGFHAPTETLKNKENRCWVYWSCSLSALDFFKSPVLDTLSYCTTLFLCLFLFPRKYRTSLPCGVTVVLI